MRIKEKNFVHFVSNLILLVMTVSLGVFTLWPDNTAEATSAPYYNGSEKVNGVALMINVYWGTEYVEPMLDVLDEAGARCTFFVGGSWARANPDLLKEIVARGHEIGNHGYSHLDHSKLSAEKNVKEIQKSENIIFEITGVKTTLFAPPSGAFNASTVKSATSQGYRTIMWTKDTIDWRDKDPELTYRRATSGVKAGDFVLMHPTKHTLEALPKILEELKRLNLTATTVGRLLGDA